MRGNSISTLEDVVEVKENSSLTSLSLKGVDGEDANPVCALANYSAFMMSNLPNLLVLDGGHVKVRDAFGSIEDDLEKLRPDPSLCATPPPEPWFGEKDLDVEAPGKRSKALSTLEETENTINTMLGEDCAHLLRKATQALSKAGTKK